eukprot:TRINITY_DN23139_c0_g2_i1.p1 TRINITY_DN23139_c0_g2~~TRINITY_DN23139_c0_g2_i1.p1  ORF type:complete len:806 (+),score=148.00 TRINITY_DN23139_c0_g2_i1:296-2419(+)
MEPRSAVARCNLGGAYFERGDEDAALHWYKEAHRWNPRSDTTVRAVALLEQRSGNFAEALWLLRNYLQEVDSNDVQVLHQLARLYQDKEQWAQAAGCYKRLLQAVPSNNDFPRELQRCLDHMPNAPSPGPPRAGPGGGVAAAAEGFALDPLEQRGRSQHSRRPPSWDGHRDGGGRYPSWDRRPPSMEGHEPRDLFGRGGSADRGRGRSHSAGPSLSLQQADELRVRGQLQEAYSAYRKLLDADGSSMEALRGVVYCLLDTGHGKTAIEAAKRLQAMRPTDAEANLLLAEALLAAGYPGRQALSYLQLASAAPQSGKGQRIRVLVAQAKVALFEEDFKKALNLVSEAVRMDGGDPKALLVLGEVRLKVADYEPALRALSNAEQALRKEPRPVARPLLARAHGLASRAQERLRRYPEAMEEARRALELDPSQYDARMARALAMHQSSRNSDAITELQELLRRHPRSVEVALQLGYVQLSSGDPNAAHTLQDAVSRASAEPVPRSLAGSANVYLALALDSQERATSQHRAEQLARDGLALHRNLEFVWRAQEKALQQQQPPYTAAVQQLRGICDLDLTSLQARRLLALLARATGRQGLVRPLASTGAWGGSAGGSAPSSQPNSRPGSVPPPSRHWAPWDRNGSAAVTPSGGRSPSPREWPSPGQVGQRRERSREPPMHAQGLQGLRSPWSGGPVGLDTVTVGYQQPWAVR